MLRTMICQTNSALQIRVLQPVLVLVMLTSLIFPTQRSLAADTAYIVDSTFSSQIRGRNRKKSQCNNCKELIEHVLYFNTMHDEDRKMSMEEYLNREMKTSFSRDQLQNTIMKCLELNYNYYPEASDRLVICRSDSYEPILDSLRYWLSEFGLIESQKWAFIHKTDVEKNLEENLLDPNRINQGKGTNLCAYAATTRMMIVYDPKEYVFLMLSLYRDGAGYYHGKYLEASSEVRASAGILRHAGMQQNKLDQMLLLVLAETFQNSFINLFPGEYKPGAECKTTWAGTTIQQFDRMIRSFGYSTETEGADFLPGKNYLDSIIAQLNSGEDIFLLINSGQLKKNNWHMNLSATHFVQIGAIIPETVKNQRKQTYTMIIWDYGKWGVYTHISRKKFNAFTYAYTRVMAQN